MNIKYQSGGILFGWLKKKVVVDRYIFKKKKKGEKRENDNHSRGDLLMLHSM